MSSWVLLILGATTDNDVGWSEIIGTGVGLSIAGGSIFVLGRLAIWAQWQIIESESKRNRRLSERVDEMETKYASQSLLLDSALADHRSCERRLSQHEIDSDRKISRLEDRIGELEHIIERRSHPRDE